MVCTEERWNGREMERQWESGRECVREKESMSCDESEK